MRVYEHCPDVWILSAASAPSTQCCCCGEELHPGNTQGSRNCPCKDIIVYPLTYRSITYLRSLGFILGIMFNPIFLREIGLFSQSSSLVTSLNESPRQTIHSDFWLFSVRWTQLTEICWDFSWVYLMVSVLLSASEYVSQGCRSGLFFFFWDYKFLWLCLQLFILSSGIHHCW